MSKSNLIGMVGALVFANASLGLISMARAAPRSSPAVEAQLDAAVPRLMKEFSVPGAAVAVIENGKVVLLKGYGSTAQQNGRPVTSETLFNVGSVSKSVTAWGGMLLVQQGQIGLDDSIDRWLTRWRLPATNWDNNGVTVRRVLSHTAGLSIQGYGGWGLGDPVRTLEESLAGQNNGAGELKLIARPGSGHRYSGGGYTLLQLLIEELSGQSFADFMQARVLRPLDMRSATYDQSAATRADTARGHNRFGDEIAPRRFTETGAAGLYASISDMSRFALAHMVDRPAGGGILTPEMLDTMAAPSPGTGGRTALGYAIGGDLFHDGQARLWHAGTNPGYQALFVVGRQNRDGLVVLTNGFNGENLNNQIRTIWLNAKASREVFVPIPVASVLAESLRVEGVAGLEQRYEALKSAPAGKYQFGASELNTLGLNLLEMGRHKDAIGVLELNTREYPQNFNVWDSLGEAYEAAKDTAKAITAYERSFALNPDHTHARDRVTELRLKRLPTS